MELVHSGKVRDLYADGDDIILVASDRVSVYDVILPTPIPDKGKILTQLSLWWFGQLADVVPNHIVSASDVPPEWAGRAIRCRRLEMIPVECIARGYLAGLGLASYQASGTISGVSLPPGLTEGAKLPAPVFTPTTKAAAGHDEPLTYDETAATVGPVTAAALKRITLEIYRRGATRRRNAALSSPTRNWNSAARRMVPSSSPTKCSRPTRRDSGRLHPGPRDGRSIPSTSSSCATGRPRSTGTGPHPGRPSLTTSLRPPARGMWTCTSD